MSSTKNSTPLTLNALISIADKYSDYALAAEAWDFSKSVARAETETTALRYYICAELSDTFSAEKSELEQLSDAATAMKLAKDDLNRLQAGIEQHLLWVIIRDFWEWFKQSRRVNFTPGILNSWIEVHHSDIVRDMAEGVRREVAVATPLRIAGKLEGCVSIDPELIQEVDLILASKLRVKPEEPKPAVETPPAAPAAAAPPPTT